MVNENNCTALAITSLLQQHYPSIAREIKKACAQANLTFDVIQHTNDYWCRDFMPLQVSENKYVQFKYDPSYYKSPNYENLKTNLTVLKHSHKVTSTYSDIVLDGGNVVYFDNIAIITDKIFKDNPGYEKQELISELYERLELERLIILPALPYDITGHADGMLKFVNPDTLLVNDFRFINSTRYWSKLLKVLKPFNIILLPNSLHVNRRRDDATGDYLNMTMIKDSLLVPAYNNVNDILAHTIIKYAFPGFTIIPIVVNKLSQKGGVLHCATWNYCKQITIL